MAMRVRGVLGLVAACVMLPAVSAQESSSRVRYRPDVVDADLPGGYAVSVVDVNADGRPDLVANSLRVPELAWYENPTWTRHLIASDMPAIVNVAAADLDGDGRPELAVQSGFAMVPARSEGLVWLLRSGDDVRKAWRRERLDAYATSHHIVWADVDGDGSKELINAPLVGPGSLAPTYDQDRVPLFWYAARDWVRRTIADDIPGILHRVRPVRWHDGSREQLLAASFGGITLYSATGQSADLRWESRGLSKGHDTDAAPRLGASDVAVGRANGERMLASVEPWHGNEVVVYRKGPGETWTRRVLFDGLVEGHEVAVADLDGDGHDDIVAGDRSPEGTGVHVFYAPAGGEGFWAHQVFDAGVMAASGCVTGDLDADRRLDIVCVGSSTSNLVWYRNLGTDPPK
jgi:hypothetical protein